MAARAPCLPRSVSTAGLAAGVARRAAVGGGGLPLPGAVFQGLNREVTGDGLAGGVDDADPPAVVPRNVAGQLGVQRDGPGVVGVGPCALLPLLVGAAAVVMGQRLRR